MSGAPIQFVSVAVVAALAGAGGAIGVYEWRAAPETPGDAAASASGHHGTTDGMMMEGDGGMMMGDMMDSMQEMHETCAEMMNHMMGAMGDGSGNMTSPA